MLYIVATLLLTPLWTHGLNLPYQRHNDTSPTNEDKDSQQFYQKCYLNPVNFEILNKLNPANIIKPLQNQFDRIREQIMHPNNPGLNPQRIWEVLHEKGHHFLTGIQGATVGLNPVENHDYPLPYRKSKAN